MSFISVFDVLGPNMIGPSSSHTAGAAVIAYLAHKMIAPPLKKVDFTLYGSFAKTYHGHGTDRALLGGIMGFSTDDTRIRNSFSIATERGLSYSFTPCETETDVHPNTVDIRMENAAGQVMTIRGESLGGGKCRIARINGVEVDFTGEYSTVIVVQQDQAGRRGAHHQGAQRQGCKHCIHAPVPRVQGQHRLHHRRVGRSFPRGH